MATLSGDSIKRGGFGLHYASSGSGSPLLILSGGPGLDASYVRPVAAQLSKTHRCIVLEQRGTGLSSLEVYVRCPPFYVPLA